MTNWRMEDFAALVPDSLKDCSGKVFYSGRKAFEAPSLVYILGINPGGDPKNPQLRKETVGSHTKTLLNCNRRDWSEYRDEAWGKYAEPGSAPFQKRVQYLCSKIGKDVGEVPASNVIFKRSTSFSTLQCDAQCLVDMCWPFHQSVIETLGVRIVVCLGKKAGPYVRDKMGAKIKICNFEERNRRGWLSEVHERLGDGLQVVTLTHPSVADWTNAKTDPTGLVVRALRRLG